MPGGEKKKRLILRTHMESFFSSPLSILNRRSAFTSSLLPFLMVPFAVPVLPVLPDTVLVWLVVEAVKEEVEGGRVVVDLARARDSISYWSKTSIRCLILSFMLHTREKK